MEFITQLAHIEIIREGLQPWVNALILFWALLLGHALADFPLQGSFLAVGKDRHANLSAITGGKPWPKSVWLYCLTIHSLVHATMVWAVTGSVILSLVEFVLHWFIDLAKNEDFTTFYTDQALHITCKLAYAGLFLAGITLP